MSHLLQASGANEVRRNLVRNVFYLQQVKECIFCKACVQSIKCWKQPRYCLSNGLNFPVVDHRLQILTRLEERLVAARHIFQTIWPSHGGQLRCKGGIVNVPVSVDTTVSLLPHLTTDAHVVHVRIARRMQYKGNYITGSVRPNCIWQAAVHLRAQPLYQFHSIALSDNWLMQHCYVHPTADANIEPEEDEEEEDAEPLNPDAQETMLSAEDGEYGIRMAPGKGRGPVSVLLDEDTEYLSFPTFFGGHKLQPVFQGHPLSYSDIAKSFAVRYGRRVAQRPDYLLFMAKKIELLRLSSNISLCLRKRKIRNRNDINASNLSNNDFIYGLVQHDDAYSVLTGVRNSCTHWHNEKQKVLAMVRQFGLPTFFLTLSAAETQWPELL
ncbi:unnamed protein product [Gongylonema pulchrum]|uniref:Helitron_like_N domain-containing protein n=1 Tax=Gongylonema pulchrum TaxID=637853 RepID=A0A183DRG7_9BILA|nr:unnamed protein product [Gongylonema pulchrum]